MTQPVSGNQKAPASFPVHSRGYRGFGLLSVLCVSEDLLFLERLRRNLEQRAGIFVEISSSAEDALLLMDYILFDAVITDSTSWRGEQDGFLKAMRERGIGVPFICFSCGPVPGSTEDKSWYGQVRYLVWGEHEASPPYDELTRYIRTMAVPVSGDGARRVPGLSRGAGEHPV